MKKVEKVSPKIDVELDILLLVLFSHGNVPTVLLQFVDLQHPEAVVFHTEGRVYHIRDAVLQHPLERSEQVWIHRLDINQADALI